MSRKNNQKQSPIEIILFGSWMSSAIAALFILIVLFVVIPSFNNSLVSAIAIYVKPYALIAAAVFVLISLIKFIFHKLISFRKISTAKKINANQDFTQEVNQRQEPVFAQTTLSEFLQRPSSWSLKLLQEIEWKRFEELSTAYYLEKGILAKPTSLGADGGIDIKLYQDDSDNPTSLVQCKSWYNRQVGVKDIREFLGVLTHEKITKGFYMTSGVFSDDAKVTARANKINLINGEMFLTMIMRLPDVSQKKLLELAIAGDYKTPTCSLCGVKMARKKSSRGEFWGCVNYPKCRQKLNIRKGA